MAGPYPFTKTRLLVVEGKDEINFFEKLLDDIGISNRVDIRSSEGKDNFKNLMQAFTVTSGFGGLEMIAVIRDADENANNAFKSVTGTLKEIGLKTPDRPGGYSSGTPSIGVFIMPDNSSGGMLEDLCLDTVIDHEAMKCVDEFIDCTQKLRERPKNISKAKVQAFLAAKPKIVNSLGRGAKRGYWNLESEKLQPLITFLNRLK